MQTYDSILTTCGVGPSEVIGYMDRLTKMRYEKEGIENKIRDNEKDKNTIDAMINSESEELILSGKYRESAKNKEERDCWLSGALRQKFGREMTEREGIVNVLSVLRGSLDTIRREESAINSVLTFVGRALELGASVNNLQNSINIAKTKEYELAILKAKSTVL